jgi:serine/threonine protein kinase
MLCGTVPFKAQNLEDLHKLILKGEFTFPVELTEDAQQIVRGMIRLNPRERHTIPQILAHHWLKETNEDDSEDEEENKDGNEGQNQEGGSAPNGANGVENNPGAPGQGVRQGVKDPVNGGLAAQA